MRELTSEEVETLENFISEGMDNGSHFPGMSYEDGMRAVLDVLEDSNSVEEVTNQ